MAKQPRKAILDALNDLTKNELEEFCLVLRDGKKGPRIPKSAIENKTIVEITDKIVGAFNEDGAIEVTLSILKEIYCSQVAQDLEKCIAKPKEAAAPDSEQAINLEDQKSDLKRFEDMRNKYKEFQQTYTKAIQHNKKQVATTEKQIKAEIEKLVQFLREEERTRVGALKEEEKQKAETVNREMKQIQGNISYLSENIAAVEQGLQKPNGPKIECSLSDPKLVSSVVIDVSKHLGNLNFSVWEKMKEKVKFTPVILDPNTAWPWLSLSEDLTSVSRPGKMQQLPNIHERFSKYHSVLGSEGFSSGKGIWEVEVGDHPGWGIGLVKKSVDRKGESGDSQEEGTWCLWKRSDKYTVFSTNKSRETIPVQRPPEKIRVQLDYDRGQVSFYDPGDKSHIHTYNDTFTEMLYPYFFIGDSTIDIKVCQVESQTSLSEMIMLQWWKSVSDSDDHVTVVEVSQ